jgi:hypothetical protein
MLSFLGGSGVGIQIPVLARQVFYHWSHVSSPFLLYLFFSVVSLIYPRAVLDLHFLYSCNDRHVPSHPDYWLRWDFANFLSGLASNCGPPVLYLLCNKDYSISQMHLAYTSILENIFHANQNVETIQVLTWIDE